MAAALGGLAVGLVIFGGAWFVLSVLLLSDYPDVVVHNHLPDMFGAILLLVGLVGIVSSLAASYTAYSEECKAVAA